MIGTIIIGSGNHRYVYERDRNRGQSIRFAHAICDRLGIRRGKSVVNGGKSAKRRKGA